MNQFEKAKLKAFNIQETSKKPSAPIKEILKNISDKPVIINKTISVGITEINIESQDETQLPIGVDYD